MCIGERASVALTPSGCGGREAYELLHGLCERCRATVALAFGEAELYHSGALITRVCGEDEREDEREGERGPKGEGERGGAEASGVTDERARGHLCSLRVAE